MGGFGSVAVMNEIFGWQIRPVSYQDGPFYRSKRNAHNTVFDGMPSLLQSGREPIYGVHMSTLPPGARSYYDSMGDCVVFAVRYDLGMHVLGVRVGGTCFVARRGETHFVFYFLLLELY